MEKAGWAEGREKETSIGNIVVVLGKSRLLLASRKT